MVVVAYGGGGSIDSGVLTKVNLTFHMTVYPRRRLHCLLTPAPSASPRFETPRCGVSAVGFPFSRRRVLLTVALIPSWSCFLSLPRRPTKAVAFASAYTSDCASAVLPFLSLSPCFPSRRASQPNMRFINS
ncbi:hypothetical protein PIB30_062881 [Stylosanthes scabra]|uniref:Uncharacterized protein n=1 Tax=Stylosanthes scabra TaxID=79078 RepID=A0ABU6VM99_9FABA|nr:hypothetical protein [Stylosanthes scabra]